MENRPQRPRITQPIQNYTPTDRFEQKREEPYFDLVSYFNHKAPKVNLSHTSWRKLGKAATHLTNCMGLKPKTIKKMVDGKIEIVNTYPVKVLFPILHLSKNILGKEPKDLEI